MSSGASLSSSFSGPRIHPALANITPIIPHGRIDPSATGVTADMVQRLRKRRDEEEALRAELYAKERKLKKSLRGWERFEREGRVLALRTKLCEDLVKELTGEGRSGMAF